MRKTLLMVSAAAGLIFAAPALAAGHGGGGGGGFGGGVGGGRGHDLGAPGGFGPTARDNSRGPDNASDQALGKANSHSVLSGHAPRGSLAGLSVGQTLHDTNGATIGQISRVVRSPDGKVRNVLVSTGSDKRRMVRIAPGTITVAGGVATTTTLKSSLHGY
ncbi:MAG TPA: hypothetical protein VFE03_08070 [Caulobacteraceae bacterium]|nr:hypothetical protein [Caulobacteraceae bacterium]